MSISPVPEASEWSMTSAPHMCTSTQSLMPTQNATDSWSLGSISRNQISFVSGDIGWMGVPVRRCSASPFTPPRSRSACGAARVSPQVMTGVIGSYSGPRPIRLCIADENEMPRTRSAPTSRATSATAR